MPTLLRPAPWTVTAAAAAVAGALLAGCAVSPPAAQRYVPPPVGASAEYRVTNTGSFGSGSVLLPMRVTESTWQGRPVRKYDSPAGATLQDPETAGVIAVLDPAGRPLMRYAPPLDYRFPLVVGKTWADRHVLTVAGTETTLDTTWRVEAYEDVTVPAGTFKAWRLVMTDNFGFRQTSWSVPERMGMFAKRVSERPPGHPQGAGTQVMEMTKVPALRPAGT